MNFSEKTNGCEDQFMAFVGDRYLGTIKYGMHINMEDIQATLNFRIKTIPIGTAS